jgi:hypothetical protein
MTDRVEIGHCCRSRPVSFAIFRFYSIIPPWTGQDADFTLAQVKGMAMNRTTAWICLLGGIFFLIQGIVYLVRDGDWILLILSLLIVAFSATALVKRPKE